MSKGILVVLADGSVDLVTDELEVVTSDGDLLLLRDSLVRKAYARGQWIEVEVTDEIPTDVVSYYGRAPAEC